VHVDVNLVSWPPHVVSFLVKAITAVLLGLLAFFCRTKALDRRDPRFLAEIALVVLTMLFISERSWKHHFVTLLIPYSYLVWELYDSKTTVLQRCVIATSLLVSALFMATTSTEFGGQFAGGRGHVIAQGYGMFLWAGVVLYAMVAWRLRARQSGSTLAPVSRGPGLAPHVTRWKGLLISSEGPSGRTFIGRKEIDSEKARARLV
jgi:hypothetical protein